MITIKLQQKILQNKNKILWIVLAVLFFAISVIAYPVYHQAASLNQQQHETNKRVYENIKDTELKNYVELAEQAIAHLYHSEKSDADTQKGAKDILRNLSYGPGLDGYFFLFDINGVMLMHPRQPKLVGQNLWTLPDENGDPSSVKRLIQQAKKEGAGFVNYKWPRPSNENTVSVAKRAYVSILKNWGWVLGTGVYLDDRDAELKKFDKPISINIIHPMIWIIGISSVGLLVIGGLIWSTKRRSEVNIDLVH
jgi:two-component system NarL family sensor kinase